MERSAYKDLVSWKCSNRRKPLLLQGARQVGKTWLLKKFGENEFSNLVYVNFEETPALNDLFAGNLDIPRIVELLNAFTGAHIIPGKTLLFLDEIQMSPRAITALKYFCEQLPQLHIVAAGSLLGVSVGTHSSFPVGKVNFMNLYPLTFEEFLNAVGESSLALEISIKQDFNSLPDLLHNKLDELFRKYLFVGGMPEVVSYYITEREFTGVREIQNEILESYSRDFSKYASSSESIKISEIWRTIPSQLTKENKKFTFSDIRKGSRHSQYSSAIQWLHKAGLIQIITHVSVPKLPLSGYVEEKKMKLLLLDTGLLGAMLKIHSRSIISPDELFKEYNGAFIENVVGCELAAQCNGELYYWSSNNSAEVDYIVATEENKILPLEVKSGMHRNLKSIRSYADKYAPNWLFRISPRNFTESDDFRNIPLYCVSHILHFLNVK